MNTRLSRRWILVALPASLACGNLPEAWATTTGGLSSEFEEQISALELRAGTGAGGAPGRVAVSGLGPPKVAAYQNALARLIDLIDRGESTSDQSLSADAASLLSQLNATEGFKKTDSRERLSVAARPGLPALRGEYLEKFRTCRVRADRTGAVAWHVRLIAKNRSRYENLSKRVGVPWYFIGIVHGLEASFNFLGHLHNGDVPLTERTRSVPKDMPVVWLPPSDWESSAIDALTIEGFVGQKDWSLETMLYRWEAYNGFSYRGHGISSPYLWSFSNHYTAGKYIRDGVYDARAVSGQCGAAVMLKALVAAHVVSL